MELFDAARKNLEQAFSALESGGRQQLAALDGFAMAQLVGNDADKERACEALDEQNARVEACRRAVRDALAATAHAFRHRNGVEFPRQLWAGVRHG